MKDKILIIAFAFLFISCTQIKSGHFVKVQEGESFKSKLSYEAENVKKKYITQKF